MSTDNTSNHSTSTDNGNSPNRPNSSQRKRQKPQRPLGTSVVRNNVSRYRFANSFVRAMASDFEQYGVSAIKRVRAKHPAVYLKVCAMMLPKEVAVRED